jgi:uncharacterized protein YqeY
MAIFDDLTGRMTAAMRAKDQPRLDALRNIRAAFLLEMKKNDAKTLPDEACIAILRKLEKQRLESIEAFEAGARPELAARERADLAVVREFLPSLADEATTRTWVREAIEASGAARAADVGKVMGALMKAHKGDVDGNLARRLASELLAARAPEA